MIVYFFANFGHVATIPLEYRKTVKADWYVNHCLPKIFRAWCKRRPQTGVRGLLFHHDNASAYTAAVTLDFLAANDVRMVTHPPYSLDLAPVTVSERRTCPSIHRGRHFGHIPVNMVGCHRQLV